MSPVVVAVVAAVVVSVVGVKAERFFVPRIGSFTFLKTYRLVDLFDEETAVETAASKTAVN